ncbi:MAG: class II aldolase [Magnetococcales bacterium]|nr:class II aldolase [Magnetococcales bacterium]MBF0321432.1 class II aldolase [Magnetococcales bacterium]
MSISCPPKTFYHLSGRIGQDINLIQGGGGNTSFKQEGILWVKGSGTWLSRAEDAQVFVPLFLDEVRQVIAENRLDTFGGQMAESSSLRPSIETSMHALLPHTVVLHVHSVNAIAWAVLADAPQRLAHLLGGMAWAWIPYRRPGLPLTREIVVQLAGQERLPDVLFLGNHGLVVGGENCAAAESLLWDVERRLALPLRATPAPVWERLHARISTLPLWRVPDHLDLHAMAFDPVARALLLRPALYPDHVVYLGRDSCLLPADTPLDQGVGRWANAAFCVVENEGVLFGPALSPGAEAMLHCHSLVTRRLASTLGVRCLTPEEEDELTNWDAEKYRQAMDHSVPSDLP